MIRLYQGTGSIEIDLCEQRLDGEKWIRAKTAAVRLLRAKGLEDAADLIQDLEQAFAALTKEDQTIIELSRVLQA